MLTKYTYSSHDAPWQDACSVFEKNMQDLFSVKFDYKSADARPLQGDITAYNAPGLSVASLAFSPHIAACAEAMRSPSAALFVSLQKKGETHIKQASRECVARPGDIFLFDPSSPFALETSQTHVYSIYLPRRTLTEHVPHIGNLTALRISGAQGAGALLRLMLDELFSVASSLTPQALAPLTSVMTQLVSAALISLEQFDDAEPRKMNAYQKSRILAFIQANLSDPTLNASSIAEGVGLSTRYVYQLFEDESMSLMKWIWAKRLEQCRLHITSPALRNKSISEIAYDWGFSDAAHFSRVFKAAYGQTPRDCRTASQN